MKVKRLVSVLLAALLLVGMIPMNALAAMTAANPKVEVKLMLSTQEPDPDVEVSFKKAAKETDIDAGIEEGNGAWQEYGTSALTLQPTQDVYLGIKIKSLDPTYTGVYSTRIFLKYDNRVLEPANANQLGDDSTATKRFQTAIVTNYADQLGNSFQDEDRFTQATAGDPNVTWGQKYRVPDLTIATATTAHESGAGYTGMSNYNIMSIGLASSDQSFCAVSDVAEWDVVIPLKVVGSPKANYADIQVIDHVTNSGGDTYANVQLTNVPSAGGDLKAGRFAVENQGYATSVVSNDVRVNVEITEPNLSAVDEVVAAGTNAQIKLRMNEYAEFEAGKSDVTTSWTVTSTGGGNPKVTNVTAEGKVITLTVDDLPAGDVTVTAAAGTIKKTDATTYNEDALEVGLKAETAPTVTKFDHATGAATIDKAGAQVRYKTGANTWSGWIQATGTTATLNPNQLKELAAALSDGATNEGAIEVSMVGGETIKSTFSGVNKAATPENPGINYTAGTTDKTVPNTVEYGFVTDKNTAPSSYTEGKGAAVDLQPDTLKYLKYHTKGDDTKFASNDAVLEIPAKPVINSITAADGGQTQEGKSKVTTDPAGITFKYTTAAGSATATDGANIPWTLGETITAQIEATNSSFASAQYTSTTKGLGWNYSIVNQPVMKFGTDGTIELTKTGPEAWKTGLAATDFKLETSAGEVTLTVSGPDGEGKVTLTPEGGLSESSTYTLTVKTSAINGGNLQGNADNDSPTPADQIFRDLSSNGVKIKADGFKFVQGSEEVEEVVVPSTGEAVTLTVAPSDLAGKKISKVELDNSADASKVVDIDWTDNTITLTVPTTHTGSPNDNVVALKITTEAAPLGYADPDSFEYGETDPMSITPSNAAQLKGVTITVSPVGSAPVGGVVVDDTVSGDLAGLTLKIDGTKFTAKGKYQYKIEGDNGATSVTITVTATNTQAVPDFTGLTKIWDGKDTLIGNANVSGTITWTAKNQQTKEMEALTGEMVPNFKYYLDDPDVSDSAPVTVDPDGTLKVDNSEYDVKSGSSYTMKVVAAEVTGVTANAPTKKVTEGTASSVASQIGDATVTIETNADGVTIEKKLSEVVDPDEILNAIIDQIAAADKAKAEADETAKAQKAYEAEKKKAEDPDSFPAFETWIQSATTEEGGDTTWQAAITKAGEDAEKAVKDPETGSKGNTKVPGNFELNLSGLTFKTQDALDADDTYGGNVTGAGSVTPNVTALNPIKVNKKTTGGGGSYVPNVELETDGFATPAGPVEVDEDGKITKLPGVIGQKLGTVFKGWATQAGNANTIVKEGRVITGDTTLYGIFEGYMNGDYNATGLRTARPEDKVTRAELATMLVRAAGIYDDSIDYSTSFSDAKGAWYTTYIGCAETAGIMSGYGDGTAHPRDYITREEVAAMIANTFKVAVASGGTTDFVVDFNKTSNWAKDYVAAIVNNGTAVGNDHQEFEPGRDITRAEVAAMINKYIGLTAAKKSALAGSSSPFVDVQNSAKWFYAEMLFASMNAPYDYYVTEVTYPSR